MFGISLSMREPLVVPHPANSVLASERARKVPGGTHPSPVTHLGGNVKALEPYRAAVG